MKHGRRLTKKQKCILAANGYNPENWLAVKNLLHENKLEIVHKTTGNVRVIEIG